MLGTTGYVGSRIKRREDPRLITGKATYTDDMTPAGTVYLHMVRSPHAHANIGKINSDKARTMPGVMAVITGEELNQYLTGPLPAVSVGGHPLTTRYPIATDKVRYVGEIVAAVVADSRYTARDAAEAIEVEYQALQAVVDMD